MARKLLTHCRKRGHALTDDNVYVDPIGRRQCRACRNLWHERDGRRERVPVVCPQCKRERLVSRKHAEDKRRQGLCHSCASARREEEARARRPVPPPPPPKLEVVVPEWRTPEEQERPSDYWDERRDGFDNGNPRGPHTATELVWIAGVISELEVLDTGGSFARQNYWRAA